MPNMLESLFYTSKDLCKLFECSNYTLQNWINAKKLPDFPEMIVFGDNANGGKNLKRRWKRTEVDQWIKTHQ